MIDKTLYHKKIYYFIHRNHVAFCWVLLLSLLTITIEILRFPNIVKFIIMVCLLLLFTVEGLYTRFKFPLGHDLNYLYNKNFYHLTFKSSIIITLIYSSLFFFYLDSINELYVILSVYMGYFSSVVILVGSILMLKTAFRD